MRPGEDDAERTPMLIDWRAEVARPFHLATGHTTMGLRRRRHISTDGRPVTGLHDEILDLGVDSVLVVEPGEFGTSDLYVALTRATQRVGVLYREDRGELPVALTAAGG